MKLFALLTITLFINLLLINKNTSQLHNNHFKMEIEVEIGNNNKSDNDVISLYSDGVGFLNDTKDNIVQSLTDFSGDLFAVLFNYNSLLDDLSGAADENDYSSYNKTYSCID